MDSPLSAYYALAALGLLSVSAVWWDLRERRIPDALTLAGCLVALGLRALDGSGALLIGLGGLMLGFLFALPFFLAGGLGGGDLKLLAAVGAFLGPERLLVALLATALAGGLVAVAASARRGILGEVLRGTTSAGMRVVGLGRGAPAKTLSTPGAFAIPYAPPIALGAIVGWFA